MCQSLFEYVGDQLYKSDNALKADVWRIYWNGLPALKHPCQYILQTPTLRAFSLEENWLSMQLKQ